MEYPTRNGLPISPIELGYNNTTDRQRNNHHAAFTARSMGRLLLTQTFRDLDSQQHDMSIREHDELHREYDAPRLALSSVYRYVMESRDRGDRIRIGSLRNPTYSEIDDFLLKKIEREYGSL